jgi:hypothetical protein
LILAIGIWSFIWPTILLDRIASETRALDSNQPNTSNVPEQNGPHLEYLSFFFVFEQPFLHFVRVKQHFITPYHHLPMSPYA